MLYKLFADQQLNFCSLSPLISSESRAVHEQWLARIDMSTVSVDKMVHDMLDFLAFGPAPVAQSNDQDQGPASAECLPTAQQISLKCRNIERQWAARGAVESALKGRLRAAQEQCRRRTAELQRADVLGKYQRLCSLEAKHQLVLLHKALLSLHDCADTTAVPALVADVVSSAPPVLPQQSRLYELLLSTTQVYREKILTSFQSNFENHLRDSADATHSQNLWVGFLADARAPVVAFVLLSMLPVALAAVGDVVEAYEESLDRVLAPMWSRLHFHLTTAREEGTLKQLVWSFQYAKNFIETLATFASAVITDTFVCQLLSRSGHTVSADCILKKVSRFMRAHVAVFVEVLSPLSRDTALQMIESALELDGTLEEMGLDSPFVSEVICDYKPAFKMWIEADREYALDRLRSSCPAGRDDTVSYSGRFTRAFTCGSKVIGKTSEQGNCFICVYEACWLLLNLCRRRYSFVPLQCEDSIAAEIVEPVLCAALGLLLFRIRTHPVLVALSKQSMPNKVTYDMENSVMGPVCAVLESAQYLLDTLGIMSASSALSKLHCSTGRFERRWLNLRRQLSATSMFASARGGSVPLKSATEVVFSAFSPDLQTRTADGLQDKGTVTTPRSKPTVPTRVVQQSLKDIFVFAESQLRLMCQGLVEEYKEVAANHFLPDNLG